MIRPYQRRAGVLANLTAARLQEAQRHRRISQRTFRRQVQLGHLLRGESVNRQESAIGRPIPQDDQRGGDDRFKGERLERRKRLGIHHWGLVKLNC